MVKVVDFENDITIVKDVILIVDLNYFENYKLIQVKVLVILDTNVVVDKDIKPNSIVVNRELNFLKIFKNDVAVQIVVVKINIENEPKIVHVKANNIVEGRKKEDNIHKVTKVISMKNIDLNIN